MLLQEVIKQRVVVIYGGRFQPMGGHHHKAYQRLVDKFGSSNVFVATSNATSDKSPFNFAEKKKIISAYGVPSKQIVRVKNVYQANEITKKLSSNTVVLWAVGAKDVALKVGGKEMSGTTIRQTLGDKKKSSVEKKKVFKGITGLTNPAIYKLIIDKLTESMLVEGGASGHMSHPWENIGMSFADIKKMISALLSGGMDVTKISEKTDGQNLNITYHDGEVVAARNKTQSKNFGANGLTIAAREGFCFCDGRFK